MDKSCYFKASPRLKSRKNKTLANKCFEPDMVDKITEFCAQVNAVREIYAMEESNAVNYDKTHVFLTSEG